MVVVAGAIAISLDGVAVGGAIAYNYIGGSFDPANPDLTNTSSTVRLLDQAPGQRDHHRVQGHLHDGRCDWSRPISARRPSLPGSSPSLNFGLAQVTVPIDVSSELVSVAIGAARAQGVAVAGSLNLNFVRESVVAAITGDSNGPSMVHGSRRRLGSRLPTLRRS